MSDRSSGAIQIGGKLPKKLLEEFLKVLKDEGLIDDDDELEDLPRDEDGAISFMADDLPGGGFWGLEAFLVKHKIDFDRQAGGSHAYDAEDQFFRKGMSWENSKDSAWTLRQRIRDVLQLAIADSDWAQVTAFVALEGTPPPLERFEVVDE